MKHSIMISLASGQLRPRRVYNGEYVASRCGRFLRRIGGGKGTGAVAAPNGIVLCSDPKLHELGGREGLQILLVRDFAPGTLRLLLDPKRYPRSILEAVSWMLKEGPGLRGSGMRGLRSEPQTQVSVRGLGDLAFEPMETSAPLPRMARIFRQPGNEPSE